MLFKLVRFWRWSLLSLALGAQAREAFEERDRLMSEVLQKTKALNVEAEARSQVERERAQAVEDLRLEAETKIALFSDATHHLNNPLNHITGAREIIGGELTLVRERLDTILPDDDDPDVKVVRKAFGHNFEKIAESEMRLDDALSRASNAVAVLRSVSGVDGVGSSLVMSLKFGRYFRSASLSQRRTLGFHPRPSLWKSGFLGHLVFTYKQWKYSLRQPTRSRRLPTQPMATF